MIRNLVGAAKRRAGSIRLSPVAAAAASRDRNGGPGKDPGSAAAIEAGLGWLSLAQDRSRTDDGGVARDYGLVTGWASSYPETTGYIVPTFLDHATLGNDLEVRARRMLDWLVSIQLADGAFQGGMVDETPVRPVTFNTGQILIGLVAGAARFGEPYARAMTAAADWLVKTQSSNGCWRAHPSPFAKPGEKTYDTHVAWALLEAARLTGRTDYAEAGLANMRWATLHQRENGFLDRCCLSNRSAPLTHTLGYALRGLLEGYRYSGDSRLLDASLRLADGIRSALRPDGFLAGRLDENWKPRANWSCLTGAVQVAACWLLLFESESRPEHREAGIVANAFVRRTLDLAAPAQTRGAVKGSFPIDGAYNAFLFPNWAAKFMIDSCALEQRTAAPRIES